MSTFSDLIERIKKLNLAEVEDIHRITEQCLIEKRREEMAQNHTKSMQEHDDGELEFSDDINSLKVQLNTL